MPADAARNGHIHRQTKETDIDMTLVLDGGRGADIVSGVPFMDHMLTLFAVHGFFDLTVRASGDTEVDDHHTVEDLGICLGQALKAALGDFGGIRRYGQAAVPMDEALARVTLDISNRPFLHYGVAIKEDTVGRFDTGLVKEFLRALALHGGLTLHVEVPYGENNHHIIEAIFKALGQALAMAVTVDPRCRGKALSSKGVI